MTYPVNATAAMPNPGNAPLRRFHLVKGPVYRQASLCHVSHVCSCHVRQRDPLRSFPRISCAPFVTGRRGHKLLHVEAGRIGRRHGGLDDGSFVVVVRSDRVQMFAATTDTSRMYLYLKPVRSIVSGLRIEINGRGR